MTRPRRGRSPTPTRCRESGSRASGRSVADQVLDAVDSRMRAKPVPGVEARLAGQRIGAETAIQGFEARPQSPAREQTEPGQDPLAGTSFSLTGENAGQRHRLDLGPGCGDAFRGPGGCRRGGGGAMWRSTERWRAACWAWTWTGGNWTTGLLLTHSRGEGGYRGAGTGAHDLDTDRGMALDTLYAG